MFFEDRTILKFDIVLIKTCGCFSPVKYELSLFLSGIIHSFVQDNNICV